MMNHHAILKEELKKIANNINKKYATLRKQVLKTAEVFQNQHLPVFPYQVCFGLFRQVNETASISSSLLFFPFIQAIINLGFCDHEMSRQILTMLLHTKSIPKFQNYENQTKLQQILNMLISKKTISLHNIGFVHSLINLFLSLENLRYRNLWTKTTTSLSQITMLLTNEIKDYPQKAQQSKQILNQLLTNFVKILKGIKIQWLIEYADFYIFAETVSEVLDEQYFQESGPDHEEIFMEIIPVARKELQRTLEYNNSNISGTKNQSKGWELSNDNKILIILRVTAKINLLYKKGFQILQQLIRMATDKRLNAVKHFAYEALNFMFKNYIWMHKLLQSDYVELFNFLLTTEFNTIKSIFSEHKDKVDLVSFVSSYDNGSKKIMNSNQIDLPSFEFNCSYEVRLIIKNLEEVTQSLYSTYMNHYNIDLHRKLQDKQPLQKTYKFCQKTVFETIKAIMPREMSEEILQSLLKISEKFINMSGCFGDMGVSALYLKMMCKYCLPSEFKNIGHRHVQINKMILNTVNCLGHLLSSSCWVIVWKALQNYSLYYNRYLLGKQQLQAARESDVQILYKSMDSIFTETPNYQNQYLLEVLRSLIEVAYECLQNNYNDETRKIFAFERIEQIYRLNLFRIHTIWPQLSSSLLCITTAKVLYFRISALNLLNILIPLSLNYLKNHKEEIKLPLTQQNYEQAILEPWINLVNCQFQEIRNQFIVAVNKLIIDYGHIMLHGWKCILEIVKKTHDLKSLQAIVETFLQKVHDNIMDILMAVDALERQLHDTNQKYLCLTMIWAIGDYAHKNQQNHVLRKVYEILLTPQEMFNLGTQARHSSFYIFAEIIVHNCNEKQLQFWQWIFDEVKNFYEYGISESKKAKDREFVEEAMKNLLTNLIKIYKKFFLVSKNWESKDYAQKVLGQFYLFCEKILEFRSPQLYQYVIKQTKEVLISKKEQSLQLPELFAFLNALSRIYFIENDTKILKCLITYLPGQIYDLLGYCIDGGTNKNFITIYRLIEKIFLLRLQAIEADIKIQQLRIFFQEKYHYEFMKKLSQFIMEEQPTLIELYTENLTKTIHKLYLYNDYASIFKSLPFLTSIHLKQLNINSDMVLDLLRQLIMSRSDQNWLAIANNYKQIPIWFMTVQDIIKIGHQYIQIDSPQALKVFQTLKDILFEEFQTKLQFLTQEKLSQYYEAEIQIINFLTTSYFFNPQYHDLPDQDLTDTVQHLNKRSKNFDLNDFTKKAHNAYALLFKLSKKYQSEEQVIIDKQKIFVNTLFKRILESMAIISSEISNEGTDQVLFVLKKMLNFEVDQRILIKLSNFLKENNTTLISENSLLFKTEYGHLLYFQPYFAQGIVIQSHKQLNEILIALFTKISEIVLGLST